MRWRVPLTVAFVGFLAMPTVVAAPTLQQQYLDIYLKINDAEHLEKQGDYRSALEDFKDCYAKLAKIHDINPDWEKALVTHRMDDCKAKIIDLTPKADAQTPNPPPTPVVGPGSMPGVSPAPAPTTNPDVSPTAAPATPEEVAQLRLQLQAVRQELAITKQNLADSQAQLETYRTQLASVNQQLKDAKAAQSVDDKMGALLSQNKELTDKLASAQKEIDGFRSNPKSKLAMALTQLKNVQDQFNESQAANTALQTTTTNLKTQLDQAQADLNTANQKLAASDASSTEYQTLKRENEVMRGILTRELQEQAHRDMAKRLFQEEYDNLKLKSKVLQEQVDILASPMTPPTNEEERALLASLKTSAPDVNAASGNTFSAPTGTNVVASPMTPDSSANPATPTNGTVTPPPPTPDTSTNPNVTIVSSTGTTPATNPAPGSATPAPAVAPDAMAAPTNTAGPTPLDAAATNAAAAVNSANPPSTDAPTRAPVTPVQTEVTTTHIDNGGGTQTPAADPTDLSHKARLPDDMRETAQQAADLFKNQKYDESAAKYQSIIDKYPESLYAWSNLGVVRFQQGKFDEALKALQQAVKLSPTDAFSYSNLGIVYYQLNQFENAIEALNNAKALDPNDAKTHNYLGCACSQKGWQEVAEKEFRKAIEIDPNFGDAHFNLALVYATSKPPSIELARREYNRALELGIAKDARLEKILETSGSSAQAQASP